MSTVTPIVGERLWIERRGKGDTYRAHRVSPSGKPFMHEADGRRRRVIRVGKIGSYGEGSVLVPISELVEARPISAANQAEYDRLDAALAGTRGDDRLCRSFFALLHRSLIYGVAS